MIIAFRLTLYCAFGEYFVSSSFFHRVACDRLGRWERHCDLTVHMIYDEDILSAEMMGDH